MSTELTGALVLGSILLLLVFGRRRHGRAHTPGERLLGVALIATLLVAGVAATAWRALLGDGACLMGQCSTGTGGAGATPVTARTTLDGHWIGRHGRTTYVLDVGQSGSGVAGTGTRAGAPLTVSGSASPQGVQLDLGGIAFTGAFTDANTVRGLVRSVVDDGAAAGDDTLELKRRGPRQDR